MLKIFFKEIRFLEILDAEMASEMTNIIKNNDYVIMKRENDIKAFKVNLKR